MAAPSDAFFRIHGPPEGSEPWALGPATDSLGQDFDLQGIAYGRPVLLPTELRLRVRQWGRMLDWSWADFGIPVVRPHVRDILGSMAARDCDFCGATVEGTPDRFAVVNVTSRVSCLDESRSEIIQWRPESPAILTRKRPFLGVGRIVLDRERIGGEQLFRLDLWTSALIVTERLRDALADVDGVFFEPV